MAIKRYKNRNGIYGDSTGCAGYRYKFQSRLAQARCLPQINPNLGGGDGDDGLGDVARRRPEEDGDGMTHWPFQASKIDPSAHPIFYTSICRCLCIGPATSPLSVLFSVLCCSYFD